MPARSAPRPARTAPRGLPGPTDAAPGRTRRLGRVVRLEASRVKKGGLSGPDTSKATASQDVSRGVGRRRSAWTRAFRGAS